MRPARLWLEYLAIGLACAGAYAAGACPTVYVGDSGELATAAVTLGIPHPTGYPLYVLLGKLWTVVFPLGPLAWRLSVMSALAAGAACATLYAVLRHEEAPVPAALAGALLLAVAPSFWGEANVQRVYALGALFLALALRAAQSWSRRPTRGRLARLFFVCGLGATNHVFMAVVALVLVPWALWWRPALWRPRRWLPALAAFVVGLLPYTYLPLRSRMNPVLDWGDPQTAGRFLDVVLRRNFWERAWLERWSDLLPIGADWAGSFVVELGAGGVALAVLGAVAARRRPLLLLAVLVMAANVAVLALHGSRSDLFIWHRYYVPSYLGLALAAGLGAAVLAARLPRPLGWLPVLLPLAVLPARWRDFDRSRYEVAEAFSRAVLDAVPPGATLVATDDNVLFVLIYLHHALGLRPDVDLVMEGVGGRPLPSLRFDPERDPVFFTHHPNWRAPGLAIVPRGLVFQAWRTGLPVPPPHIPSGALPGEDDPRVPKDYLTRNLIGHFHYMLGVSLEERDWPRARREFDVAMAADPDNDVLFYNLGLIFFRAGLLDDARAAFARCQAINPRHLASRSRPRAADRLREVAAEAARLAPIEQALVAGAPGLAAAPPGSAAYHMRLAALLAARGELRAAEGERRLAAEAAGRAPVARHGAPALPRIVVDGGSP